MKDTIFALASAFSTNDLLRILRDISRDEKVSDYAIETISCALCLGYMNADDAKEILDKIGCC